MRQRIAGLVSLAYREVSLAQLEAWLGLSEDAARKFVTDVCGWTVAGDVAQIPRNPDNEAKKAEIREDVNAEMFGRVIRRAWEETV